MTRVRASLIHFSASALVVSVILAIIYFVWYPGPTFRIAGALDMVFVLVGVHLVLGPLLMLVVYKQGKPGLKFDIVVIVIIQFAALSYGSYTLFQERPSFLVFAVDRFNIVAESHIDRSLIRIDELKVTTFADIVPVFARLPDGDELQEFMTSVVIEGQPDLERRPEYWEPYDANIGEVLQRAKPLSELKQETERDKRHVRRAKTRYQDAHPNLGYVPIGTLTDDIGMLVDMDTAEPIDIIDVDPW